MMGAFTCGWILYWVLLGKQPDGSGGQLPDCFYQSFTYDNSNRNNGNDSSVNDLIYHQRRYSAQQLRSSAPASPPHQQQQPVPLRQQPQLSGSLEQHSCQVPQHTCPLALTATRTRPNSLLLASSKCRFATLVSSVTNDFLLLFIACNAYDTLGRTFPAPDNLCLSFPQILLEIQLFDQGSCSNPEFPARDLVHLLFSFLDRRRRILFFLVCFLLFK
jgi:hypothetical protein